MQIILDENQHETCTYIDDRRRPNSKHHIILRASIMGFKHWILDDQIKSTASKS